MSKDSDFLDLDVLDQAVKTKHSKNRQANVGGEGEVLSPTSNMLKEGSKSRNVLERTMKRRDEKASLEKELDSLKSKLADANEVITLKMPVSNLNVRFKKEMIDPGLIDVSSENQRVQSLLDMSSISDIYQSILDEGQSEPGFLKKKTDGRYELVSGSRRLFCVKNISGRKYLALVGDIPSTDIRRLSRLENQQSPISVYEKALSFKQDIASKKVRTWEALAAIEGFGDRQMKKYKALSELPIAIVKAFSSPSDLSLEFADWLSSKFRKDKAVYDQLLKLADQLITEKNNSIKLGESPRSAIETIAEFKSCIRVKNKRPTIKQPIIYKSKKGESVMRHTVSSKGTAKLEFSKVPQDKLDEIISLVKAKLGLDV